jgi:hypothetical protein
MADKGPSNERKSNQLSNFFFVSFDLNIICKVKNRRHQACMIRLPNFSLGCVPRNQLASVFKGDMRG